MKCSIFLSLFLVASFLLSVASQAPAAILYESGTLGPTGIPRNGVSDGSNVSPDVFVGVRFHLEQPVMTAQIGGHFVKNTGDYESFFGAIVALSDENDFPDSGNLATPDVVGNTLLSFPEPSDEIFGTMTEPLTPGWYAVVFGSGLFGATGSGVALNNGVDIGDPEYIAFQPGFGWSNLQGFLSDFRFVVTGEIVPEPATVVLALIAFTSVRARRRSWQLLD